MLVTETEVLTEIQNQFHRTFAGKHLCKMHVLVQNDTNRSGGDSPQASIGSLTFALRRLVPPVFLWSVGEIVEKTSW